MKDNLQKLTDDQWIGQHRSSIYLAAEDIDPAIEPILTIEGLYYGEASLQRGKENKYVIGFVEKSVPGILDVKPLVCNATNKKTLKKIYGGVKPSDLVGKKVKLYIDHKVRNPDGGGLTDGIRIRPEVPKEEKPVEIKCEGCGKAITPAHGMDAPTLANYTFGKYKKKLCAECATKEGTK